ncbi:hypothetical protein ACWD4L_47930 [Streptomyces sp. NPDC002596]
MVEQAGEDSAVGVRERGLADLALQDEQLVPKCKVLDVFVPVAHRQQAQEREGFGRGEVGQAQQHEIMMSFASVHVKTSEWSASVT